MEEIFLDMEMMTMTTLKMVKVMKVMDLTVIPMSKCMVGATYARRNAYQHRDAFGVAAVGKESCIPSV
eukprot:3546918-Amphidinium_carterae.1